MIKLVGFHVEKELHKQFKSKLALSELTQDQVLSKFLEDYVKNG